MKLGLERVGAFLEAIGAPQRAWPAVHVAGTNGKGSVCMGVTEALVAAGYRVGTTLSPHVQHINERVRIDGVPVSDAALCEALDAVDAARPEFAREQGIDGPPLTYFEAVTSAAFWAFARHAVDVGVVEVGLGGRLDATRVVQPAATAIVSIGMDHADVLGDTLGAIAREKAGILRAGVPAVIGPLGDEALSAILAVATPLGVEPWRVGRELRAEPDGQGWALIGPGARVDGVVLGMSGAHQLDNALVAFGLLLQLRAQGWQISDEAILVGLGRARLPARFERVAPGVWVDGAHNPPAAEALASALRLRPRSGRRVLLFGLGGARDALAVVRPLLGEVDAIITAHGAHPAARTADQLAEALAGLDLPVRAGGAVEEALPMARAEAAEVIVAGSLFLAGAVRDLLDAE